MSSALKRLPSEAAEIAVAPPHPGLEEAMRVAEALLFAATEPLKSDDLAARLPASTDIEAVLEGVASLYAGRGINLVRVAGGWAFRTAPDLAYVLAGAAPEPQKLSRAALETLAIIAYHQPTTRAEIEEIRGVSISKGTLDTLLETGWIRLRGRRRSPGRPLTYGTTPAFLAHFGLDAIGDLPGLDELKGLGFLEGRLPPELTIPMPNDDVLREDEDPLDEADLSLGPRVDETD
jgi:segregation and condensation protein B